MILNKRVNELLGKSRIGGFFKLLSTKAFTREIRKDDKLVYIMPSLYADVNLSKMPDYYDVENYELSKG